MKGLSKEFIFYPIKPLQPPKNFKCSNDMIIFEHLEEHFNIIFQTSKTEKKESLIGSCSSKAESNHDASSKALTGRMDTVGKRKQVWVCH